MLETSLALAVIGATFFIVAIASQGSLQVKRAHVAIEGMKSALCAALEYREKNGSWPASINDLNLPTLGKETPWGNAFAFENPTSASITVKTQIPSTLLDQIPDVPNVILESDGTIRMTITLEGVEVQDLEAEKKALY